MEKFFNTAGPNKPDMHYEIDPLSRFDLSEVLMLIRQQKYFVMHAPRQTGKTTWEERLWHRPRQQNGRTIMVWGM
jgi:hypothetical protein